MSSERDVPDIASLEIVHEVLDRLGVGSGLIIGLRFFRWTPSTG